MDTHSKSRRERKPAKEPDISNKPLATAWAEFSRLRALDVEVRNKEIGKGLQRLRYNTIDGEYLSPQGTQSLHTWADAIRSSRKDIVRRVTSAVWRDLVQEAFGAAYRKRDVVALVGGALAEVATLIVDRALLDIPTREMTLLHYLPCYLFDDYQASNIEVGRVRFTPSKRLEEELTRDLQKRPDWLDSVAALEAG